MLQVLEQRSPCSLGKDHAGGDIDTAAVEYPTLQHWRFPEGTAVHRQPTLEQTYPEGLQLVGGPILAQGGRSGRQTVTD